MRALTDAEARVIGLLLSSPEGNERDRLRQINVPRSTYHAARRRAYSEGWLRDRYVPDPFAFGFPRVTFLLVRPHVDRLAEVVSRWGRDPGNVLLWASTQFALGVFYHSRATPSRDQSADAGLWSWSLAIDADSAELTVPVYFDFEGLWTNLSGLPGAQGYPHGLGGGHTDEEDGRATPRPSWAASELIRRPFLAEAQGRPGHLVGPFGLAWSQQRMLRSGQIAHRVFLDPGRVPPFRGRQPQQYVFVTGTLREGVGPERLFAVLTRESRVYPFLYVAQERTVLMGAVGGPAMLGTQAPPRPERRPVMPALQQMVEGIDVLQDQISQVSVITDHRYDRLLPATNS